jgi:choline dehydrogenase-like flavoprotein
VPEWQERERAVHVGAEVYYPVTDADPLEPARRLASALRDGRLRAAAAAAGRVARSPLAPARAAFRRVVLGRPASVGSSRPHLGLGGEQEPDANSRVTLSRERDALGMRRTRLEWRVSAATTRSFELFARALDAEWRRLGLATLDLDDVVFEGRERGEHGGYVDASHHMGTTRMGTDPRTSVVDADCRVHGVDNLFIGSSAVFPTGGASNPTFTMLALCLRMADGLKVELARSPGELPAEVAADA